MLKSKNEHLYNSLFTGNKIIIDKNNAQKNISEELLTAGTLILVRESDLQPETEAQLNRILAACKLQKGMYKVETAPYPWQLYRGYEQIREVLLFGVTEKDLNIEVQFAENQINKFDGRVFIKSAGISQIAGNQEIKNALWQNALKPHFLNEARQLQTS